MLSYGGKIVKHGEILIEVHLTVKKYKIKKKKEKRKEKKREMTLSTTTFTIKIKLFSRISRYFKWQNSFRICFYLINNKLSTKPKITYYVCV